MIRVYVVFNENLELIGVVKDVSSFHEILIEKHGRNSDIVISNSVIGYTSVVYKDGLEYKYNAYQENLRG